MKNYIILILLFLSSASAAAVEPGVVIKTPPDNYFTNISLITISGEAEPEAALSLDGNPVLNSNGTFLENVMLAEGLNIITVEAMKDGRLSKASVNITLDTISPDIVITSPALINSTSFNLTYTSSANDVEIYRVRLNNSAWNATNRSYYLLNLTEGSALIEVQAIDRAGNTQEAGINLTVDLTPPSLEILKPAAGDVIKTRFVELAGKTEPDANISVNGMNLKNDNGTWSIAIVLSGVDNPFRVESTDRAGNIAEKTINIRPGANFSAAPFFLDFLNLSVNFSSLGRFEGTNDVISGKYVSFLFDRNASAFMDYSINTTLWFNTITIKGFTPENSSISGPVAIYRQGRKFGEQHSVGVEIHDNSMGTILIDIRQFEDVYAKVREYLMKRSRERLKINVSRDKNVTLERIGAGDMPPFFINESWKNLPEVAFELAGNVNVTEINNGFRFARGGKEAYLFRADYAGGTSDFTLEGNRLSARVNNSLLVFRQFPDMNMTEEDILDRIISQGISDGIIGAEFFIDDIGSYDVVTFGDLTISAGFPDTDTMELNVSSASPSGTVIAVGMSGKFFNNMQSKNLSIRYDGSEVYEALDYQDIMDVTNDLGHAEYMLAMGKSGAMVLVSIPGFSSHTISFKFEPQPGTYSSSIVALLNFLSAGLFLAIPATNRELVFSGWWFAIVLMFYFVLRKAVRKK